MDFVHGSQEVVSEAGGELFIESTSLLGVFELLDGIDVSEENHRIVAVVLEELVRLDYHIFVCFNYIVPLETVTLR